LELTRIPDEDRASSIVSRGDDALEISIFEGMILHHDGEPFVRRIYGRSLGNGP
jgi:hypothetical protein